VEPCSTVVVPPSREATKPAAPSLFLVDPTTIKLFNFLIKRYYVWLRVNLIRSHITKQAQRKGLFDKDKTCLNSSLGADF
jgi:hypothetical protein